MSRIKKKWLGARADDAQLERVKKYLKATNGESGDFTMGDLVRVAVDEYMLNHPVKKEKVNPRWGLKQPGKD